jgi:hypothetical protein
MPALRSDLRLFRRQKVFLFAHVERFGAVEVSRHRVRDISPAGARIDSAANMRTHETIVIDVGSLCAVGAKVVWTEDGEAGLAFAEVIDVSAALAKTVRRSN